MPSGLRAADESTEWPEEDEAAGVSMGWPEEDDAAGVSMGWPGATEHGVA